jgi:hypothetical protein
MWRDLAIVGGSFLGSAAGAAFMLGLMLGSLKEKVSGLDKRVTRIEQKCFRVPESPVR